MAYGLCLEIGGKMPHLPHAVDRQAVVEGIDAIGHARGGNGLPRLAKAREDRHADGSGVVEADLGNGAVFVANENRGLGDALEAYVLAPQAVAIATVDIDADRRVGDGRVDQGQVDLVLANGGLALALEAGIDQSELPGG